MAPSPAGLLTSGTPRANHVAMAHRGDLLVFGGEVQDGNAVAVRCFSRSRGWEKLNCVGSAPSGRVAAAAASIEGDRLYVFGGFAPDDEGHGIGGASGVRYTNAMHVLDLRSQPPRWRALTAEGAAAPEHAPSPRRDATLTFWPANNGGALFAFGGWDLFEVHGDLRRFQLQPPEWTNASTPATGDAAADESSGYPQPLPRRGHSCTLVHGQTSSHSSMLLYGGCLGLSTYLDDLWSWSDHEKRWCIVEASGEAPGPRAWHSATAIGAMGHLLVILGGRSAEGCGLGPHLLDGATSRWAAVRLPLKKGCFTRHSHTATLVGAAPRGSLGVLLVFGGRGEQDELLGDLISLDVLSDIYTGAAGITPPPKSSA